MYNILVCDDDKEIVEAVRIYLEDEGYRVFGCYNGEEALQLLRREDIHLVLLDVMMPKLDGLSASRQIRKVSAVPIIMISAKSQDTDKIIGLNVGADDYVTKPFNPLELVARVKSNLRRYMQLGNLAHRDVLAIDQLEIDDARKEVRVDGELVKLTPIEYNLLLFLAQNKGRVFSIAQIYENVWKEPFDGMEKKVVVHISHLRDKIEINPKEPRYLKSVWGLGYKLEDL
nr:response regulator transcription factor [Maliibacterium massiliense]